MHTESAPARISVAMATYNGERFLGEQLESLSRQSLLPHELVVCDDGSSDGTLEVLESFGRTSPFPVRILANARNTGYGDAFLRAAAEATGDWIAFCDQDDVWLDHKLSRCADLIGRHPEVVYLSHSADQVGEHLEPLGSRVPDHRSFEVAQPLSGAPLQFLEGFAACIRRDLLQRFPVRDRPGDVRLPGRGEPHDLFIFDIAFVYGPRIYLPETLALYRRHGGAASGGAAGVHARGTGESLRRLKYTGAERIRRRADRAGERVRYFGEISRLAVEEGWSDELLRRSRDAVLYFEQLAFFFGRRASLYDRQAGFPLREWRRNARGDSDLSGELRKRSLPAASPFPVASTSGGTEGCSLLGRPLVSILLAADMDGGWRDFRLGPFWTNPVGVDQCARGPE